MLDGERRLPRGVRGRRARAKAGETMWAGECHLFQRSLLLDYSSVHSTAGSKQRKYFHWVVFEKRKFMHMVGEVKTHRLRLGLNQIQ